VALSDYILKDELVEEFLMDLRSLLDDVIVTNVHLVFQDNQGSGKLCSKYMKVHQQYVKERLET
jgi:hypothetical protein